MLFFSRTPEKKSASIQNENEKLKNLINGYEPDEYAPIKEMPYPEIDIEMGRTFPKQVTVPMEEKPVVNYSPPTEVSIVEKTVDPLPISRKPSKSDGSAPLFIKVDRYNEILDNLQQTKALLSGVKSVFPLLLEVDNVKKDAIDALRLTMQKIEKNIVILDSSMAKPGEIHDIQRSTPDSNRMEESLNQLQRQLGSLKNELERMK